MKTTEDELEQVFDIIRKAHRDFPDQPITINHEYDIETIKIDNVTLTKSRTGWVTISIRFFDGFI